MMNVYRDLEIKSLQGGAMEHVWLLLVVLLLYMDLSTLS